MLNKVNAHEFGKSLVLGSGFYNGFFAWSDDEAGYLVTLKIEEIDSQIENWVWFVTHVSGTRGNADEWTQMRRLSAVLFLIESHMQDEPKLDFDARAEQIIKMSYKLTTNIVSEFLGPISLNTRRWHWAKHKDDNHSKNKEFLDRLGINRATTLDYLNLQALAIKDYQRIIATTDNQNILTIRDRIAYARRHEWIDKVGHGVRTPEMTKLRKKKEGK
jgi:hypothetical protein